jgi:5-methylcytosine-specific restriction endonuclease McrA
MSSWYLLKEEERRKILNKGIKDCSVCHRELPLNEFYKDKTVKSGIKARCKECMCNSVKAYLRSDKGKVVRGQYEQLPRVKERRARYMKSPDRKNFMEEYRRSGRHKAWWDAYMKTEKYKESQRRYSKSEKWTSFLNSEEGRAMRKEAFRKYKQTEKYRAKVARENHKRRALEPSTVATLMADDWEAIKKQYKYRCVYCGEKKELARDHIIPLSKNGPLTKENIVPACKRCNSIKGNRPVLLQLLVG